MTSLYQDHILDHYRNPRHHGPISGATHQAKRDNPTCGDHIALDISVRHGNIVDIGFDGSGCAISQASASLLSERVLGMKTDEAAALSKAVVLDLLGIPISPTRLKCALLALDTLQLALRSNS